MVVDIEKNEKCLTPLTKPLLTPFSEFTSRQGERDQRSHVIEPTPCICNLPLNSVCKER